MEANRERLKEMIQTLFTISEPCEAGVQRQSYSAAYRRGVDYIKMKMRESGLVTREDGVGNVFGRLEGTKASLPAIMSGSHLDTVRCAGGFDGIAGVVCAIEAARMIKDSGHPLKHPFTVVGTIGEEGTRFWQVLLGSQFMTGVFGEEQLDSFTGIRDGKTMREAMKEYGLDGDLSGVCIPKENVCAVLELHGEQGPVLEEEKKDIGIVNAIVGIAWLEVTVTGESNHSGTVPMDRRKDAGIGAYEMILSLNRELTGKYLRKATMTAGQLILSPGSPNCIPGKCTFTLDIRSGNEDILKAILESVKRCKKELEETGLKVELRTLSYRPPVLMAKNIQEKIEQSCRTQQLSWRYMDSGAGHDAMIFAKKWPTAMLFLPNRDGISHNPAEYIDFDAMKKGTEVLYETLRFLDESNQA